MINKLKNKFTIPEAAEILNIENGRLREFISRKYIKVAFPASGHGSKNFLNRFDLYQVKLFVYLLERGINRIESSRIVKSLYDYFKSEVFEKSKEHLFFAYFKRSMNDMTIQRKDIDKPYITDEGRIVSNKGLSPGVRILTKDDLDKSFETLFLTFDDDEASEVYDFSKINFQDILIINMADLVEQVEDKF